MLPNPKRLFLGCVAGALSILIFHQTVQEIFFWLGLAPYAAFRIAHVPPFNAPLVVSLTFWGAVYGGVFGVMAPLINAPRWLKGIGAGLCAMLLAWFLFLPLIGREIAFGWQIAPMLRSFVAYQAWGLGIVLILPLLGPRSIRGTRQSFGRHHLAA